MIWLPEETLPGFRKFETEFYGAMNELANTVLEIFADGLKLTAEERKKLLQMNSQNGNQLRLLHYPPVSDEKLEQKILTRMPAHTDWG